MRRGAALSERKIAARIAGQTGANAGSVRAWLRRVEQRKIDYVDEETAAALVDILGVGVDVLGEQLLWVIHDAALGEVLDFGGRILSFTDAAEANRQRDALALRGLDVRTWELRPSSRDRLDEATTKYVGDGYLARDTVLIDPSPEEIEAHLVLEIAFRGEPGREGEWARAAAALDLILNTARLAQITARRFRYLHETVGVNHQVTLEALRRLDVLRRIAHSALKPIDDLADAWGQIEEANKRRTEERADEPGD